MNEELAKSRQLQIDYFNLTLKWIGTAVNLAKVAEVEKNSGIIRMLRKDLSDKVAAYNVKSERVFNEIIAGRYPPDFLDGDYAQLSDQVQVGLKELKEQLDGITL